MAKNKVSEWSSTPGNNTDIGGIDIAEGCAPSGINNAIRELMSQVKDLQAGTDGDNLTVGGNLVVTGTTTFTGGLATALPLTSGGTGATSASGARTSLGLGTLATQNATAVAITGGSITGITDLLVADGGTGASSITANSVILGNGTGALSGNLVAPGTSGNVLTSDGTTWSSQPATSGLVFETAQSASSTSVLFSSIPTTAKRIMVVFKGVSSNGTSHFLVRVGTGGSVSTSGYSSGGSWYTGGVNSVYSTAGFVVPNVGTSTIVSGIMTIVKITGNTWVEAGCGTLSTSPHQFTSGGDIALGGALDTLSITTVNGTDTFDAGTINITYE